MADYFISRGYAGYHMGLGKPLTSQNIKQMSVPYVLKSEHDLYLKLL